MKRLPGKAWLLATGLVGGLVMAADVASANPVALSVERAGNTVVLVLRGAARKPVEATYELDVDGASTVRQKGRARLVPQGNEALVRVTIGADAPWRAVLRVTADGERFDRTVTSADAERSSGAP